MTNDFYENPVLDSLDDSLFDEALQQANERPGFEPVPKGKYTAYLTDWRTETATAGLMEGHPLTLTTFTFEYNGVERKIWPDFTTAEVRKDGKLIRPVALAAQLIKALGMRGKPFNEVLESARTTAVSLEIGIQKERTVNGKTYPARNQVYAIHSA